MRISLREKITEIRNQEEELETEDLGETELQDHEDHDNEIQKQILSEEEEEEIMSTQTSSITQISAPTMLHTITEASEAELLHEIHMREAKRKAAEEFKKKEAMMLLEEEEKELTEKLRMIRNQMKALGADRGDGSKRKKAKGFQGKNVITLVLEHLTEETFKPIDLIEKLKSEFEGSTSSLTTIVNQTLSKLISQGQVIKESRGHYKKV